ncbi:MAG: tetratricopeptide repeat protein [Xenococcaceae cyanobacterium]
MSKIVRLIAIIIIGFSLAIATSSYLFPDRLVAQSPQVIQLLQQGIELYEAEQYDEAIRVWNTALSEEPEQLSQALILNNLALAHQNLGRWQEAETIIASSLEILKNLDTSTPTYTEILAKASNTQGYLQWLQGNFNEAIFNWEVAASNYLKAGDNENAIRCKLNQTKALQAAGLSSKAKEILEQIEQELTQTPNFQLKAIGLRHLGNVLRSVGDLKRSEIVLQSSLNLSESLDTLLELGNTERALSDSYLATEQAELADKYAETAIDLYQQAFEDGNNLKAGLNQLSLLISLGKWSDIDFLIPQIDRSLESLPYSRTGIYARLNFIRSLSCIKEIAENNHLACINKVRQDRLKQIIALSKPDIKIPDWEQIARDIEVIIPQATDSQTRSYALGELGHLYESEQKWQLSQNYTQRALLTLEGLKSPEISYRWQWQLGRIWQQQGRIPEAISAYSAAIDNLKSVRRDLLIVNSEAQFSFRDNIEPIYRELVDLLLQQEEGVSQENLEQAIQSIDTLQLAEVENFLNCDLGSTLQVKLTTENLDNRTLA